MHKRLVAMWKQGKTCKEIAEALVVVSRDAVAGKARRLRKKGLALESRLSPLGEKKNR